MLETDPSTCRREVVVSVMIETHTCPYCELVFSYHEEIKDHILHDHSEHSDVVATVEDQLIDPLLEEVKPTLKETLPEEDIEKPIDRGS